MAKSKKAAGVSGTSTTRKSGSGGGGGPRVEHKHDGAANDCRTVPQARPWFVLAERLILLLDQQRLDYGGTRGWALQYPDPEPYIALVDLEAGLVEALGEVSGVAPAQLPAGEFSPGNVQFLAHAIQDGLVADREDSYEDSPPPTWHAQGVTGWLETHPPGRSRSDPAIDRARELLGRVRSALDIP